MQIRVIRRLSSFELPPEEVLRYEFWSKKADEPDLRPSVYRAEPSEVTQVLAEHAASFLSPPRRVEALRVDDCWPDVPSRQTRGSTGFAFANERHHEYAFADRADLLHHVGCLCERATERILAREKADLLSYVRRQLAGQDPEWVDGLKVFPNGPKWLALLGSARVALESLDGA